MPLSNRLATVFLLNICIGALMSGQPLSAHSGPPVLGEPSEELTSEELKGAVKTVEEVLAAGGPAVAESSREMVQPEQATVPPQDARHDEDHALLKCLLSNHQKIRRSVKRLHNGVETITESDDVEVAGKIKEHVLWMTHRLKEKQPIRTRDPLFKELFQHADKIRMECRDTEQGVVVTETSSDPHVVHLIQAHADVVSAFVKRGFVEAMRNHAVPQAVSTETQTPQVAGKIAGYGRVTPLPDAAHQPRDGCRLCMELTKQGDPGAINPGVEKIAKLLNIFAAGGQHPASVQMAVVLHGDATLAVLNSDAYFKKYGVGTNPNLDCLSKLHDAGVQIFVCGQSLFSQGSRPADVALFAEVSVSALTSLANLQDDGYAYIPISN